MVVAMILERGLGSTAAATPVFGPHETLVLRTVCAVLSATSLFADTFALYWFLRMKRKFRHTLVALLLLADLLKDINYLSFAAYALAHPHMPVRSTYIDVSGAINLYLIEITDFTLLSIVIHMSVQVFTRSTRSASENGLYDHRGYVIAGILTLPLAMALLALIIPHGGFTVIGAFAALPVRPFYFRLALSWIPRYMIAIAIVTLTVLIRFRVLKMQKKLAELQEQMQEQTANIDEIIKEEEYDFSSSEEGITSIQEKPDEVAYANEEPDKSDSDVPPMPADQEPFSATDVRKFKRMSPMRRLPTINTSGLDQLPSRGNSVAGPSAAPSSAVFGPNRHSLMFQTGEPTAYRQSVHRRQSMADFSVSRPQSVFRRQSIAEISVSRPLSRPQSVHRRQSIAEISLSRPQSSQDSPRRSSLADISAARAGSITTRPTSLMPQAHMNSDRPGLSHRRSSIWDEIDATLEKKTSHHRISIFTQVTAQASEPCPSELATTVAYNTDANHLSRTPSTTSPVRESFLAPAPSRRSSLRHSRIHSMTRHALCLLTARSPHDAEAAAGPEAVLRRRHRHIQRQLRFLAIYPVSYLALWLCPFALNVLQYNDALAARPPFAVVLLNVVSLAAFGTVNGVVFCLREKPWATVEGADPLRSGVRRAWGRVRGRDGGELDFEG